MKKACEFAREAEQTDKAHKNHWAEGTSSFQTGLEIAEIWLTSSWIRTR